MKLRKIVLSVSLLLGISAVEGGKMPNTNPNDADCLAAAIYYEARDQPIQGQMAVAQVVLNRGANICKTINQPNQFSWRTNKRIYYDDHSYLLANKIITRGYAIRNFKATHFHNLTTNPNWSGYMITIGNHKFYLPQPPWKFTLVFVNFVCYNNNMM